MFNRNEESLEILWKAISVFSVPVHSTNRMNWKWLESPDNYREFKIPMLWISSYYSYVLLVFESPIKGNINKCN